jgi:pimeloyl-ACP methyl ester carboxylesterase/acyl carrier protein
MAMDRSMIINNLRDGNLTAEKAIASMRASREALTLDKPRVDTVDNIVGALTWQQALLHDLTQIVSKILKIDQGEISADTPVTEMGLDSLSATELNNHVRVTFGLSLQATAFFECNTLRDFQQYMIKLFGEKLRSRYESLAEPIESPKHEKSAIRPNSSVIGKVGKNVDPVREKLIMLWNKAEQAIKSEHHFEQIILYPEGKTGINIAIAGDGEPVLLLAGMMNPEEIWFRQLEALAPYYRLIAFNKPGIGQSGIDLENLSTEHIIENIAYVFKALNIKQAIDIVGFSFGGMLAQEFAYRYPEYVRSMALINTSARKPSRPDNLLILKDEVESCPKVLEINGDFDLSLATEYSKLSNVFDMRNRLGELSIPALVLSAEDDRYIDQKQNEELIALLPQSTPICITGARHFSLLTHADIINRHLLTFLNSQSRNTTVSLKRGA